MDAKKWLEKARQVGTKKWFADNMSLRSSLEGELMTYGELNYLSFLVIMTGVPVYTSFILAFGEGAGWGLDTTALLLVGLAFGGLLAVTMKASAWAHDTAVAERAAKR